MWDAGKEDESLELSDIIMVRIHIPYHHSLYLFISIYFYIYFEIYFYIYLLGYGRCCNIWLGSLGPISFSC